MCLCRLTTFITQHLENGFIPSIFLGFDVLAPVLPQQVVRTAMKSFFWLTSTVYFIAFLSLSTARLTPSVVAQAVWSRTHRMGMAHGETTAPGSSARS